MSCLDGVWRPGPVYGLGPALSGPVSAAAEPGIEDERDVALARRGDEEAFMRLVRRHQAAVARLLWRFCRDRDEHEELVQEVFVRAFSRLRRYEGRGAFVHWLRRIAVRAGCDYWRRLKRQRVDYAAEVETLVDSAGQVAPVEAAVVAADETHRLLARLSGRDRLVLTLLYLEECSVAEASRLTGWSPSLVKVQAHRARARLRRIAGGEL